MSNLVVLRELEEILNSLLDDIGIHEILHENHPLINYLEQELAKKFSICGSAEKCKKLEHSIREAKQVNQDAFKELLKKLVREFYRIRFPEYPKKVKEPYPTLFA